MKEICTTAEEVGQAVKNGANVIIVEGKLKKGVITIKATGPVAWAVCIGSLGAAIALIASTPATTAVAAPVAGPIAPLFSVSQFTASVPVAAPAAGVLGSAVVPAVLIGVAAGGVGALVTLRDQYDIVKDNHKYIKLKKKKSFHLLKLFGK